MSALTAFLSALALCGHAGPTGSTLQRSHDSTAALPLLFEANRGQAEGSVQFIARNRDAIFQFNPSGALLSLRKAELTGQAHLTGKERLQHRQLETKSIRLEFPGADPRARMTGQGALAAKVHYLLGNNPAQWRRNVPTFTRVQVESLYRGIDLVCYGNQQQVEYDFVIAPGADPGRIAFRFRGADALEINEQGDLLIKLGSGQIRQHRPLLYQIDKGERNEVSGGYYFKDKESIAFEIGPYNHALPLIIDPVLTYSTYLGSQGSDIPRAIASDAAGNIYLTGDTLSGDLATPGAYTNIYSGGYPGGGGDAFLAKFDSTGSNLVFLTYLGGNGDDAATSLARDATGNIYLTGVTDSTNFPVTSLNITNRIGGKGDFYFGLHRFDAFVAKLDPTGSQLLYSTYLGGEGEDEGLAIAVDTNTACAFVTGFTASKSFPVTPDAFQTNLAGASDVFLCKLAADGSALLFSTFIGGTNDDHGESLVLAPDGTIVITGFTASTNFPVGPDAFQPALAGGRDVFLFSINLENKTFAGTYFGGQGNDIALGLALDNQGKTYLTGSQEAQGFPITPSAINPGGAFLSQDAGANWTAANHGLQHNQVLRLAVDPTAPSKLFAGTWRGIFVSTNGGSDWQQSFPIVTAIRALAVDPVTPAIVYAGSLPDRSVGHTNLMKSLDGGQSWMLSNTGLVNQTVNVLAIDPLAPSTIYAATEAGVFKSTNAAASWTKASTGLGFPESDRHGDLRARGLQIDARPPGIIYAATPANIFWSTNGATNWNLFGIGLTNGAVQAFAVDPATAQAPTGAATLYAGTVQGVFKGIGGSWTNLSAGLGASTNVTVLAVDPVSPGTVYAGTTTGLFKSIDAGTNWTLLTNGLTFSNISALAIGPGYSSNVYAGTLGVDGFGGDDTFAVKFGAYSVVFGGNQNDEGRDIVVDSSGQAFVAGTTASTDFPTSNALGYLGTFNGGLNDGFVTALNSDASGYVYSTYLGGAGYDAANGVVLDASDNAWVVGQTSSADFPAIDSAHTNLLGGSDGFLARIQSATPQVNVTFDTSPSGLSVFVDGASNSTPASVSWPAGSIHIIFAPPVSAGEGIQYAWTSWSDGGAFVHRVAPMSDTTFTANFKLQYFLGMYATNLSITSTNPTVNQTNIGALSPKSGWFDPGTDLIISTIPPLGASFAGWVGAGSGSFSGLDNPASITMNGPVTETATFTGPLTNRLKLIINGTGTVSPNYNGQALRIGKVYSMTAKPGAGYAFANWTGDIPTNISPKLTFLMQNGLVLQANFIPSPFGPVKGTYAGLFYETNSISPASSGFFTLDLTEQGNFSAKIVSLGRTYKFTSHFSTEGNFVGFVPRLGLSTLFITLRLDLTGGNVITGEINDTTRTAELVANRAVYSKSNPAPQAGRKYTLIVPGGEPSYARPAGDGYGSLSVDQSGNITFSGAMGDAVKVSQRTFVSGQNEWPFFVSYQAGAGVAIGWLSFTNEAGSAISGAVNWSKLGLAVTNIYPGGFSIETEGLGSIYSFTSGQPVLDLGPGGGWLIFEDGNLSQNITNRVLLDSNNKITNLSSNKLTMTVTTSSGLFQGSVVDPASGKTLGFKGALFQKQNFGAGYFLNGRQTGRVLLLP